MRVREREGGWGLNRWSKGTGSLLVSSFYICFEEQVLNVLCAECHTCLVKVPQVNFAQLGELLLQSP